MSCSNERRAGSNPSPTRNRNGSATPVTRSWNGPWTCSKAFLSTPSAVSLRTRTNVRRPRVTRSLPSRPARPSEVRLILLALESSCDETAVAVIRHGEILSNLVSSQARLHAEYGGVVPELPSREHLRNWMSVARAALKAAAVSPGELEALAATRGPGLPHALLIGCRVAQAMAFALRKPFLGIHHHH